MSRISSTQITIFFYFIGQIDKESLVRKQSLHILKIAVRKSGGCLSNGVSKRMSHNKRSTPQGMTKREVWAEMEAKSLGVGRICNPIEPTLNSEQKWEAFVLLYEMLEEYGTHLVEAAWNHQVWTFIFVVRMCLDLTLLEIEIIVKLVLATM